MKTVKKIEAKPKLRGIISSTDENYLMKVAGYARVSTDNEEQFTSYQAQLDYYTNFIQAHDGWEFAGMYADEGITGTNTKKRDGFNTMIADALAGKIDIIVTKSISRFARNTVDSLTTIRKLKEKGIEVWFEKENIHTLDAKGELLITIMSSLAQEESRSISENTTWGKRKQMADGKVSLGYSRFLGYDRGPDGKMVINEEQAKVVRKIYRLFLTGYSAHGIKKRLEADGDLTPTGKKKWPFTSIKRILVNEKYRGDALLQKEYTVDFLTKEKRKNTGELPMYYVEGDHEPIIDPTIFDIVQEEVKRRNSMSRYNGLFIFSSRIHCMDCGAYFGRRIWHSNDKGRKVVWQCTNIYHGTRNCHMVAIPEESIKILFVKAIDKLMGVKDSVIEDARILQSQLEDTSSLEEHAEALNDEMKITLRAFEEAIRESGREGKGNEREVHLLKSYDAKETEYKSLLSQVQANKAHALETGLFIDTLKKLKPDGRFSETMWGLLLSEVEVYSRDDIRYVFKDGSIVKMELDQV